MISVPTPAMGQWAGAAWVSPSQRSCVVRRPAVLSFSAEQPGKGEKAMSLNGKGGDKGVHSSSGSRG